MLSSVAKGDGKASMPATWIFRDFHSLMSFPMTSQLVEEADGLLEAEPGFGHLRM